MKDSKGKGGGFVEGGIFSLSFELDLPINLLQFFRAT